jgi:hypothetical protein
MFVLEMVKVKNNERLLEVVIDPMQKGYLLMNFYLQE